MSERAEQIIRLFEEEEAKSANFRTLYQDTADLMFPRENQIIRVSSPGEEKNPRLVDTTGVMGSMEMASGLSQHIIPPGQKFFGVEALSRELNEVDHIKEFLDNATDVTHEEMFGSNLLLEFNETLRSIAVFGTGCIFATFSPITRSLNFMDYDVASYIPIENSDRRIDQIFVKFSYTARQAFARWKGKAGESVVKAALDPASVGKIFDFIHYVAPRNDGNPLLRDNLNMPFASFYISLQDKIKVEEGGFPEFPYMVIRWTKASNEVWGRGQGTFALPDVRMLQAMAMSLIESANKHNNPPIEVLESFEGDVNVRPGGRNDVMEMGSIRAIERNALGNFPVTKDVLEMWQDKVRKAFFNDIFAQLRDLKGDRRSRLEIMERIGEGLQRLGPPVGRIYEEGLTPMISRVIRLLADENRFGPVPPELIGAPLKIEYIGKLALELKSHQAVGFQQFAETLAAMEPAFPGSVDLIDLDPALRRLGGTMGVNAGDIASEEEVAAKRQAKAQQAAMQQALEVAQAAGQGYKDASGAPEPGSPAAELLETASV